jgi:hypothetical protein
MRRSSSIRLLSEVIGETSVTDDYIKSRYQDNARALLEKKKRRPATKSKSKNESFSNCRRHRVSSWTTTNGSVRAGSRSL